MCYMYVGMVVLATCTSYAPSKTVVTHLHYRTPVQLYKTVFHFQISCIREGYLFPSS